MRKLANEELDRLSQDEFKTAEKTPVIVILDDIRSLNNIGSVFRTSDAFLIEKVLLCGITATPPNKEIHKTALGATESVAWEYYSDISSALEHLKEEKVRIFAIEQIENSISLEEFEMNPNERYAIIFGNEVFGVSEKAIEYCDGAIEIPQLGTKHSLNIAVSAGIVLWEFARKLRFSTT